MTKCHTHRSADPFVRVRKSIVMDSNISWKAKGILTYAFSRPDNWSFYKNEMMMHASDGRDSFNSGIKELEKVGYLHRTLKNDEETGRFEGWEWHFFEEPITPEEFKKLLPNDGKPVRRETPISGKATPTKNNKNNKKEEQQQEPAALLADFFVHECLKNVDIPDKEKLWISEHYPEESKVSKAIQVANEFARQGRIKTTYIQTLKWALSDEIEVPEPTDPAEVEIHNREQVKALFKGVEEGVLTSSNNVPTKYVICNKYIEFVFGPMKAEIIDFDEKGCVKKLKDMMRRIFPRDLERLCPA